MLLGLVTPLEHVSEGGSLVKTPKRGSERTANHGSLLVELSKFGVGCHWGSSFAGAFSYADDVVLLAPCASALRTMLNICSSFAMSHKLEFNSMKTQLMCFHCPSVYPITADIYLNNIKLSFESHVKHLGHIYFIK